MTESMSTRDAIRSATVGAKSDFKSEIVEWGDVKVEVRQMSIQERFELYKATMDDDDDKVDTLKWLIMLVVINTYVPGTNERVYEDTDFDLLVKQPTDGFIDKLADVAKELNGMGPSGDEGNSPATTNDS